MAFGVYATVNGMQHVYLSNTKTQNILEQQLRDQKQNCVFQGEQGTDNSRCKETKKYSCIIKVPQCVILFLCVGVYRII